jgi:hypothetical protein
MKHSTSVLLIVLVLGAVPPAGALDFLHSVYSEPVRGIPLFGVDVDTLSFSLQLEGWEIIEGREEYIQARREVGERTEELAYHLVSRPALDGSGELTADIVAMRFVRRSPLLSELRWLAVASRYKRLVGDCRELLGDGSQVVGDSGLLYHWGPREEPDSLVYLGNTVEGETVLRCELSFLALD